MAAELLPCGKVLILKLKIRFLKEQEFLMLQKLIKRKNNYYCLAGVTRLELATSSVTGQRSNQLSYTPECWWAMRDSNSRPSRCKRDALPTELIALFKFRKFL